MGHKKVLGLLLVAGTIFAACSDSEDTVETPTASPTQSATPTANLEPTPVSSPTVVAGRKHTYARGETVTVERGILFLDPKTGGGVAWEGANASPSGMYVFWQDEHGQSHLVDSVTEHELVIGQPGDFPSIVAFSPDDSQFAAWTDDTATIHATSDGSEVVQFEVEPGTGFVGVRWSAQGWIALSMTGTDRSSLGVWIWRDGQRHFISVAGQEGVWTEWSPDGEWLALSKTADPGTLTLHNIRTGEVVATSGNGSNPRWSESGQYLALQSPLAEVGDWPLRVFNIEGTEILRVYGICASIGTPWRGDALFAPWSGATVALDGAVTEDPDYELTPPGRHSTFTPTGVELLEAGAVVAELDVPVGTSWPSSSDDVHPMTVDGRGIFLLGVGGKGFCGHEGEFAVELPPFE